MSGPVDLPTSGRPIKVAKLVDQIPKDGDDHQPKFSHKDIDSVQLKLSLTTNQTRGLSAWLRATVGKHAIQPGLEAHLRQQNSLMQPFFSQTTYNGKLVSYCSNIKGLIDLISKVRGREPKLIKLGLDAGRNIIKFTLTLVCEGLEPSVFMETSVKRLILIGAAVGVPESYESVSFLWEKLGINQLDNYIISGGHKIINILLGLTSHSGMYSCCYCISFSKRNPWAEEELKMRSFEDIQGWCGAWKSSGSDEKDLMKFFNVRNLPLPSFSGFVLHHVAPAPLHLLIGVVNHLMRNLIQRYPEAEEWPRSMGLVRQVQHNDFNGNDCHRLINSTRKLRMIRKLRSKMKEISLFAEAFECLRDVVHGCFGSNLDPSYAEDIQDFRKAFECLNLSLTPKLHILTQHLTQYIQRTQCGLSLDSEQALEACHFDFDRVYQKYACRNLENPKSGDLLLKAVLDYNGHHL